MPKLPAFTSRKFIKKLKELSFFEDHATGSHVVMRHPVTGKRAVVPYHLKDLPKGTLSAILREAGLSRQQILQ